MNNEYSMKYEIQYEIYMTYDKKIYDILIDSLRLVLNNSVMLVTIRDIRPFI